MTDEIIAEFKPSGRRLLWRPLVFAMVCAFITTSVSNNLSRPWWWFSVAGLTVGYLFITFLFRSGPEELVITIGKQSISGPPTTKGQPTVIPISDVEVTLSQHLQGGFDGLANRRWLYSTHSKKIAVLCDGYPKGTFEQILNTIVRLKQEDVASDSTAQAQS